MLYGLLLTADWISAALVPEKEQVLRRRDYGEALPASVASEKESSANRRRMNK